MPIEGIDFVLDKNLEGKGELLPLIKILKSCQKQKPRKDEEIPLEEWEDIFE